MTNRNDNWTGSFVARSVKRHKNVEDVELLTPQVVKVVRKEDPPFLAGTIASERVERHTIEHLVRGDFKIDFIANVPKESIWTGEAIDLATSQSVAFGGLGDLLSAVALSDVRSYEKKEFGFVERGLRQHSRVQGFKRIYDRLYIVNRRNLPGVTVVLLNEYELTADHIRTARDRYGEFSDILITNPNGNPTSSAKLAADSMGAKIHVWGGFMSRLHEP